MKKNQTNIGMLTSLIESHKVPSITCYLVTMPVIW